MRTSNYDRFPTHPVTGSAVVGWDAIAASLSGRLAVAVETYSGLYDDEILGELTARLRPEHIVDTRKALKSPDELDTLLAPYLGDDPVFGRLCPLDLQDLFDPAEFQALCLECRSNRGTKLVYGPGASLLGDVDHLIYADMPRWEEQLRQRRGEVANLGATNHGARPALLYKRSYFVDWRILDRHKQATYARWDSVLDTSTRDVPKLVTGTDYRNALRSLIQRPLRMVPFFDPGPWGGQWMKQVCGLDPEAPNYAWCFDGVPEENSLRLRFGSVDFETPALNLVFAHPEALLGSDVFSVFGAEFPIRFDLLDTMGGGNLSLQVHPNRTFAREHFGLFYTQDESYYLLDAEPDACVYLGLHEDACRDEVLRAMELAANDGPPFPADTLINRFPARKHDHFSIPAGTVHCSGANCMVLEISATPYIFTFKLWDWDRMGLDGRPRPTHLAFGAEVIDWTRREAWVRQELLQPPVPLSQGEGWCEERTGLHRSEFIETRRHWFTAPVDHDTGGTVHVLNLVEGTAAVVESPDRLFAPFEVHYAETFIVPAAVGAYRIRPLDSTPCATIRASVRPEVARILNAPVPERP